MKSSRRGAVSTATSSPATNEASHRHDGVGLADALIAACAEVVDARLVTHDRKHFPMLAEVLVPYGE